MTSTCWVSRETFFENHSTYYTCVKKESGVGFMGIDQCKADDEEEEEDLPIVEQL
jgi:hypothetical protein